MHRAAAFALSLAVPVYAAATTATLAVDGVRQASSTAVATIQPRTGAPGYSWLRVYFYPRPLTGVDADNASRGRVDALGAKWNGALQLTIDKGAHVWQVDMSVPGHTCTIADSDLAAHKAFSTIAFDGTQLHIVGKGSFACDMSFMNIPNQTFAWDVSLDVPVLPYRR